MRVRKDRFGEIQTFFISVVHISVNQSSDLWGTTDCPLPGKMYLVSYLKGKKKNASEWLEKKIQNVEEKLEALERVVLVFKKFLEITPKHYYIVDRMLFSDRMKIVNMKSELSKGYDTIQAMKENLVKAIGELARTDYSDEEILDLEPSEVWKQIDGELEKKMQRNEKG